MTDGPFRNAELSGSWKKYGEDLVSDAASPGERTARICHSMLGDVDWDSISPLLKQLEASARNSQLELDPCAHVADICDRSEEHTSELQSLMRISYAVFCLKKKNLLQTHMTNKHKHRHKHT